MRENLTSGSMWQGMETSPTMPRRHSLTLPRGPRETSYGAGPAKRSGRGGWMPRAHVLGPGDVRLKLARPITPPNCPFRGFRFYPFYA